MREKLIIARAFVVIIKVQETQRIRSVKAPGLQCCDVIGVATEFMVSVQAFGPSRHPAFSVVASSAW
jgi:hypothetical protein